MEYAGLQRAPLTIWDSEMDGIASSLKLGASSRRLDLPKVKAAADAPPPPDPSVGLERAWTQAERLARWPTLDYSQPRELEPECDSIYAPHNALRSDMQKLGKALDALAATDAPMEMELENLSNWFDSFAHLVHSAWVLTRLESGGMSCLVRHTTSRLERHTTRSAS